MSGELVHQTILNLCFCGGSKPVVDRWYTEFICDMLEKRYITVADIPSEIWIGFQSAGSSEAQWISTSPEDHLNEDFRLTIMGTLGWYRNASGLKRHWNPWSSGDLSADTLVSVRLPGMWNSFGRCRLDNLLTPVTFIQAATVSQSENSSGGSGCAGVPDDDVDLSHCSRSCCDVICLTHGGLYC